VKPREIRELSDNLFSKKQPLNSLHQDIADNFYYERANFVMERSIGNDFAANTMTSYPAMCRRDLGNYVGSMLRPNTKVWFHTGIRNASPSDNETRMYLQAFEETQRRAMYDPMAHFSRATKEGDHDFAAFGQCAISVELNKNANGLLYRCWHLRDLAWQENDEGEIGSKFRRWKPTVQTLVRTFGKDRLHPEIMQQYEKNPFEECGVLHMVVEADMYDDKTNRPFWSIWYDTTHDVLISASPIWTGYYVIPRWQTVSGSQYSYSPATVCALPDARLIQAMTFTLLEAGEKATSPPMIATIDAVRSDVAVYANGITWVDSEYDEKTGEALRPITQDFRGFNFGLQMNQEARAMIRQAFFLDQLHMPQRDAERVTAFEVGQRTEQYIRQAMPLFEPLETEYNARICDDTFTLLWRNGAFGSPLDWPKSLRGADISFTFESPLHDAIEAQKGQLLLQGEQLLASAIQLDPSIANIVDGKVAFRDALDGIGWPGKWMRNEDEVAQIDADQQAQAQAQKMLGAIQQGASAAKDLGSAGESVASVLSPQQAALPAPGGAG